MLDTPNLILIIIGGVVFLLGLLSLFFPGLTRIMNAPGGPTVKSIVTMVVGAVLAIVGALVKLSS